MNVPCIPYKGSKRRLAERIVRLLPQADYFYDLFAGGGAITSAAILSGKYNHFVMNDIIPGLTQFYKDAISGKYHDRCEWIDPDYFKQVVRTDLFVGLIWSFGNSQRCFIYGKDKIPYKQAVHEAVISGQKDPILKLGFSDFPGFQGQTWRERRLEWMNYFRTTHGKNTSLQSLESLERLQSLERLERLQSLERLETHCDQYYNITIPTTQSAIIYADIPYRNTNGYDDKSNVTKSFDYDRFYDYCRNSPHPVFVSEYAMPPDFIQIAEFKHTSNINDKSTKIVFEKVFVHEKFKDQISSTSHPQQLSLF